MGCFDMESKDSVSVQKDPLRNKIAEPQINFMTEALESILPLTKSATGVLSQSLEEGGIPEAVRGAIKQKGFKEIDEAYDPITQKSSELMASQGRLGGGQATRSLRTIEGQKARSKDKLIESMTSMDYDALNNAVQQALGFTSLGSTKLAIPAFNANQTMTQDTSDEMGQAVGQAIVLGYMLCSRQFKKDIYPRNTSIDLDLIKKRQLYDYKYKEETGIDPDGRNHIGFMAEDLPDELRSKDGKMIDVNNLIGVLIGAVQELSCKVNTLEKLMYEQGGE